MQNVNPEAISVFVIHKDRYLIIRRSSAFLYGTWQMVTGGIEPGEIAWKAALREVFEETGLIPDRFYTADTVETFFMSRINKMMFVPVFVAFIDEYREVKLSPTEHDAYEWLSLEEAKERLVWAEQRRCIEHVDREFVKKDPHPLFQMPVDQEVALEK